MDYLKDIKSCLEVKLASIAGLPFIAYDNVGYNPVDGTPYIKSRFLVTSRRPEMRGFNPTQRYQGLLDLQVHTPENRGAGGALTIVETLITELDATTDLTFTNPTTNQTVHVGIEYAEPTITIEEPPWYISPVEIAWFSYNR